MTWLTIIVALLIIAEWLTVKAWRYAQAENRRLREKLRNAEIALMDRDDKLGRMNDEIIEDAEDYWPEYLPK